MMDDEKGERYRIINPRGSNNVYLYDKLLDDIVIEICTGNCQMNLVMMEACCQLMYGKDDLNLKDLMKCSERLMKS